MGLIDRSPHGFEDGHVVGYKTSKDRLEVEYEFWNEQHRTIMFDGFQGMRDYAAIGVTVGSVNEMAASELIDLLVNRQYVQRPSDLDWTHFRFLDLDDQPHLEVVSKACSFSP